MFYSGGMENLMKSIEVVTNFMGSEFGEVMIGLIANLKLLERIPCF